MFVFAFGCEEETTAPIEKPLVGKWMKDVRNNNVNKMDILVLEFTEFGQYLAYDGTKKKGSNTLVGNYVINDNIITLSDFECDLTDGIYEIEFKDNGVNFKLIEDECNRSFLIKGFFEKYDGPSVSPNPIMNEANE
jgi:hypothetical protein